MCRFYIQNSWAWSFPVTVLKFCQSLFTENFARCPSGYWWYSCGKNTINFKPWITVTQCLKPKFTTDYQHYYCLLNHDIRQEKNLDKNRHKCNVSRFEQSGCLFPLISIDLWSHTVSPMVNPFGSFTRFSKHLPFINRSTGMGAVTIHRPIKFLLSVALSTNYVFVLCLCFGKFN